MRNNVRGDAYVSPVRAQRALRFTLAAFGTTAVLAAAAFGIADAVGRDSHAGTPTGTVRDFLTTAVAEDDGVDGCRYLTARAIRQIDAIEPPNMTCSAALSSARLALGGHSIDSEAAVKRLIYHVRRQGARVWVTVSAHGASRTFALRRATASELDEFEPPQTSWRIDSGVVGILPREAAR